MIGFKNAEKALQQLNQELHNKLCRLLIDARKDAKLTQSGLAKLLGVTQSTVSKWEQGEKRLDLIELWHIAQAVDIELDVLVRKFTGK